MTIVSYAHNFIFLKTVKTAGTSLEVHFSKLCGEQDVVTPLMPDEPALAGHRPRNYLDAQGEQVFHNHMPAARLFARLDPAFVEKAYKFCFERHPVDKCISHFSMFNQSEFHQKDSDPRTWEDYVARGKFPINTGSYTGKDGALLVDRVYRYEEMETALRDISRKTTLPYHALGVRAKAGFRLQIEPTPEQEAIIMTAFERSNRITGYTLEERSPTPLSHRRHS
ncbi:MAG: hypothetical protein AAGB16_00710 [Pseudomonadota bacterium]